MELEFLSINFSEIFVTSISVLILGFISICLFFWFRGSNDKINEESIINQSSNKKKVKRKVNINKLNKLTNNDELPVEKSSKSKHIEIKCSPEIFEDSNKETKHNIFLSPTKPILRKGEDEILIDEEHYHETTWSKIPKDEVEVRRSRGSSVVSESRSILKEEIDESSTKLSRGQKKRLKAKLKIIELKSGENKIVIQPVFDASADEFSCVEENSTILNKINLSKNKKRSLNKKVKNCPSNSTESSLGNEKLHSSSSVDLEDKNQWESSVSDFKIEDSMNSDSLKIDKSNISSFGNQCDDYEIQNKCAKFDLENKDLKNEIYNLKQKLNEFSVTSSIVVKLKKENDAYHKKHIDLERTCSALQKELTNSIQKTNSAENRIIRMNSERNQQMSIYEIEMNKCNNKISILESDLRSKTTDNESLKINVEQIRHLVSEKEQLIQNQNTELSLLKEQCYKKRIDYQEIEITANSITMKYKELENQNQKLIEENQKMKFQMDLTKKESHKELEKFKMQMQNKERDQNSLITCLQYQIDEFQKEKQSSMFNSDLEEIRDENKKLKALYQELADKHETSYSAIPNGFELIELDQLKQLTSKITEGNRKLQEKCEQYNLLLNEKTEKESSLLEKNSILERNYSKLNKDLEEHLNEIVNLRTCIEKLQSDLSKTSENNIDEMKLELDDKCEALRKTEEVLTKLQISVEEEELRWKDLLNEKTLENEKFESDLIQKNLIITNQNKKINELTSLLQSTNHPQFETILNGSLSVE